MFLLYLSKPPAGQLVCDYAIMKAELMYNITIFHCVVCLSTMYSILYCIVACVVAIHKASDSVLYVPTQIDIYKRAVRKFGQ